MFISEKLIFVHLEKTGGSHISRLLSRFVPGHVAPLLIKHQTWGRAPFGKLLVGSIRNPWDYYVSEWAYGCSGHGELFSNIRKHDRGSLGMYSNVNDPLNFREWIRYMFDRTKAPIIRDLYHSHSVSRFAGLLTWRYCRLALHNFLQAPATTEINSLRDLQRYDQENNLLGAIIRNESLESDLISVLHMAGYPANQDTIKKINQARHKRYNRSKRQPTSFYYDSESTALVAANEEFLIKKFGYFPPLGFVKKYEVQLRSEPRSIFPAGL
jgi:hypothetical protein